MSSLIHLFYVGLADYLINALIYAAVAGPFFLLCWVWFRRVLQPRRIQPTPRSTPQRIWAEIGNSAQTLVIFALVDLGLYWVHAVGHTQLYERVGDYGWWYLVGSVGLMLLLHDAWFYWTHRLMHHPFLFQHVHKVHHQSVDPSPFAAFSFHPLEALVEAGIYGLFAFLFPVHMLALYGWQLIQMVVLNVIGHLGYELYPSSFTTHWLLRWKTPSTHHNMHHARFKGNYGLYFTWWDRWLNTEFADYQETYRQLHKRVASGSLLLLLLIGSPVLAQPDVAGMWLTEDTEGHVYLELKNDRLTGQLVWLSKPTDAQGNPFTDTNNPAPALRQRPLLNLLLLTGFQASKGQWLGGQIYDPTSGRTYRCTIQLNGLKQLVVRGYWGPFYKTQHWTRLP